MLRFFCAVLFLKDLLTPAKVFSLVTQKQDPHIIETVEGVEKTKRNYKRLLKKVQHDSNQVFELPTLKSVIKEIEGESDDDDEVDDHVYQGQRLKYYRRGKQYIADHCAYLIERIIACYNDRYWFDDDANINTSKTSNDHLMLSICKALNASAWPKLQNCNDDEDDEAILKVQLKSVLQIYEQFSDMDVFKDIDVDDIRRGYVDVVRYCQRYLDFEKPNPTELWHKVLLLCKDKPEWRGIALVIEICLCSPCSNATLERFFNHLKVVKTDQRTSLSSSSLNSILRIKLRQIPITHFHDKFADKTVSYWYNDKARRLKQKKRKPYKKRKPSSKSRQQFDITEFTLDDPSSDDYDDFSSSDSSDDDVN